MIRAIKVLVDCEASLIAERRRHPARGRSGGGEGTPGAATLDGVPLPSKWRAPVTAGSVIEIHTPGGGGWGETQTAP